MLLDIRAGEITELRRKTRSLTATLAELESNARANDKILTALHKLSLLLIRKPADWQTQTAALLKKELSLPSCRLMIFNDKQTALAKAAAKLPLGGKGFDTPLAGTATCRGAKRYLYLPLKKGRRACGLVAFASKKADAFPDNAAHDFSRRLAELITTAL